MKLELTFIRHGQTAANAANRYVGQTDDCSLTEYGKSKLLSRKEQRIYPPADLLFSSPLKRCKETAALLYPMLVPEIMSSLTELDFGSFEGKNYAALKDNPAYHRWVESKGMIAPPGGESGQELMQRLENALHIIITEAVSKHAKHVTVVTHGGCIMVLVQLLKQQPDYDIYEFQPENGGGFTCIIDTEREKVESIQLLS